MAAQFAVLDAGRLPGYVQECSSSWTRFCSCLGICVPCVSCPHRDCVLLDRTSSKRPNVDLCSRNGLRHMLVFFGNGILLRSVSYTCPCPIFPYRRLRGTVAGLGSLFLSTSRSSSIDHSRRDPRSSCFTRADSDCNKRRRNSRRGMDRPGPDRP